MQGELNYLARKLNLNKNTKEISVSRFHEKNLLSPGTLVTVYRNLQRQLEQYYNQDDSIIFCIDITTVISKFGVICEANE